MSQFSRVKKNKSLYHDLIKDDDTEIIESSLRDYERRVNKNKSEEAYVGNRLKKNDDFKVFDMEKTENLETSSISSFSDTQEVEEVSSATESIPKKEILNDRDLLADFIEEVKHYNINRGLRSVQDTQMNILHNLNQEDNVDNNVKDVEERPLVYEEPKRSETVEQTVEIETVSELTQEIQAIIQDLDTDLSIIEDEESSDEPVFPFKGLDEEADEELASVFSEIETSALNLSLLKQTEDNKIEIIPEMPKEEIKVTDIQEVEDEKISIVDSIDSTTDFKSNELLELTQTLNLKLDLHDKEEKNTPEPTKTKGSVVDNILTVIIVILVIALVIIIMLGLWYVYKERGLQ